MKTKRIIIAAVAAMTALPLFCREKKDIDIKIPLPSIFGASCGKGDVLFSLENEEPCDNTFQFNVEGRGEIVNFGNFTLAGSIGLGAYIRPNSKPFGSFNIFGGVGCFYNWKDGMYDLSGPCLFLYPAWGIPVYSDGYKPNFSWKSAIDLGYNFVLWNTLSVYIYERTFLFWDRTGKFNCFPDIGIALGIYLPNK